MVDDVWTPVSVKSYSWIQIQTTVRVSRVRARTSDESVWLLRCSSSLQSWSFNGVFCSAAAAEFQCEISSLCEMSRLHATVADSTAYSAARLGGNIRILDSI